jgi:hypothetical protein
MLREGGASSDHGHPSNFTLTDYWIIRRRG